MQKYRLTSCFKSQVAAGCLFLLFSAALLSRPVTAAGAGAKPEPVAEQKAEADAKEPKEIKPAKNPEDVVPPDVPTKEDFLPELEEQEPLMPAYSIWRVVFGLAFVIALILLISYALRYLANRGLRLDIRGRHIRILDNIQLGVNRTLYLVQVGTKIVLLASTDKGINYLTEITDPAEVEIILEELKTAPETSSFTSQLRGAAARGPKQQSDRTVSMVDKLKDRLSKLSEEP